MNAPVGQEPESRTKYILELPAYSAQMLTQRHQYAKSIDIAADLGGDPVQHMRSLMAVAREELAPAFLEFLPENPDSAYAQRDLFQDEGPVSQIVSEELRSSLPYPRENPVQLCTTDVVQGEQATAFLVERKVGLLLYCAMPSFSSEQGLMVCGFQADTELSAEMAIVVYDLARECAMRLRCMHSVRQAEETASRQREQLLRLTAELREAERESQSTQRALTLAQAKAEEARRLKNEFLSSVSHELRTPLNAIQGYTRIVLRDQNLNDRQRMSLERVLTSSRNQLKLINNILDYSRLEAGRMRVDLEHIDVSAVCREVVVQIEALAQEGGLELKAELPEQLQTVSDRAKIERILINLLGNAIKFTQKGSVTLSLAVLEGTVLIEVRDTGIGIRKEEQDLIFERFRQGSSSGSSSHTGTGLGLAITSRLVGLLGGRVDLNSELGEGSTFAVRIPQFLDLSTARQALMLDEEDE